MRSLLLMSIAVSAVIGVTRPSLSSSHTEWQVTVDAVVNCGSNPGVGAQIVLPPGHYILTYLDGCFNPWPQGPPPQWSGHHVNVAWNTGQAPWPYHGVFDEYNDCVTAYSGSAMSISHGGGIVSFWFPDTFCPDNAGLITVGISSDPTGPPAFEILSATFDRQVYQNGVNTAHLTVVTRSNWGHGDNLTLAVDLTPSVGSPFHMGYDHFTLGPGGERVSYFSWAVPEAEYVWEFSALVTLSDDSNLRAPLIGVDLAHAFVGNPLDEGTLQQAQDGIADCWLDSDWECVARLTAMVPGVSIAANLALFVDGMCNAGELHRVGRSEEGWAKFGGASIAAVKILLSVAPGLSEVISIASAVHSYSMAAFTCANTDFFQRIYQGGFRDAVPPGALVDSLAVWIQSGAHAVGVDFANILLLEADCATRVEADGSWATADSLGLNFVMVSEIDSVGSVTWVTKNVYRFGNDESSNPHSDGRLIVSSRANQAMNVGLLHRTSADTLVFLRYPAFGVTDSTVVSVVVADSIPVPMLEVDLNGDGTVDFLWYPGEASTVEDALSGAKSEVPVLSLASIPNPTTGPTALVLHNAVSLKGVSLSVYDVAGREVRRLLVGELSPGVHNVVWDGRADDGRQVASGIYYCVVSHAGGGSTTKRLVVVR